MELNYTVTENDYIQYNLFHHKHSPNTKLGVLIFRMALPLIIIIMTFLSNAWRDGFWVVSLIICVVWVLVTPPLFRWSIARNVKKLMKEGRRQEFIGDFKLCLGDNVIFTAGFGQTSETAYSLVEKICQDNERLYVYVGSLSALIIPKKAFKDAAEMQAFLMLLEQKTNLKVS